ncbi:MAG TPA: bifunctional ADP-heptose synthase [Thermomicrobiaceae bacterium]|nr:bifunctional ADP-heptose synthase [Thermomicrobiaceae bacterium]
MSDLARLRPLLAAIRGRKVLVVGDLYLDRYVFGRPARISREAPIMVLEESRREDRPGGGTAPALAIHALGGEVWQAGVVGNDDEGRHLCRMLAERGIHAEGVLTDPSRPTTTKTRVVAEGPFNVVPQQVARFDRQDRRPIDGAIARSLAAFVEATAASVDAVLLSDYRSGVIVPDVIAAARDASSLATVDSQGSLADFRGLALVKCNQAEAEEYLGRPLDDDGGRRESLTSLRARLDCRRLVVTLGPAGAALVTDDGSYQEVPPLVRRQVFDVTGAGDTVIAVMTAALAAGADSVSAVQLSQVAAGLVIAKWGNAQADRAEIDAALDED